MSKRETLVQADTVATADDRCHLCGRRLYILWIDEEPHNNECVEKAKIVTDCHSAMNAAKELANFLEVMGKRNV